MPGQVLNSLHGLDLGRDVGRGTAEAAEPASLVPYRRPGQPQPAGRPIRGRKSAEHVAKGLPPIQCLDTIPVLGEVQADGPGAGRPPSWNPGVSGARNDRKRRRTSGYRRFPRIQSELATATSRKRASLARSRRAERSRLPRATTIEITRTIRASAMTGPRASRTSRPGRPGIQSSRPNKAAASATRSCTRRAPPARFGVVLAGMPLPLTSHNL